MVAREVLLVASGWLLLLGCCRQAAVCAGRWGQPQHNRLRDQQRMQSRVCSSTGVADGTSYSGGLFFAAAATQATSGPAASRHQMCWGPVKERQHAPLCVRACCARLLEAVRVRLYYHRV